MMLINFQSRPKVLSWDTWAVSRLSYRFWFHFWGGWRQKRSRNLFAVLLPGLFFFVSCVQGRFDSMKKIGCVDLCSYYFTLNNRIVRVCFGDFLRTLCDAYKEFEFHQRLILEISVGFRKFPVKNGTAFCRISGKDDPFLSYKQILPI